MSGLHLIARMIANPFLPAAARLIDLIEQYTARKTTCPGEHNQRWT